MNFEKQPSEKPKFVLFSITTAIECVFCLFQNKKKEFDKTTQRYCAMIENNMKIPTKRSDLFQEVRFSFDIL